MRALIQRVSEASVVVDQRIVGQIETGLLVLLGIDKKDTVEIAQKLAHKVTHYRVFPDEQDHMNHNVQQANGKLLVVSQFTLAADTQKGLRPSFSSACPPTDAEPLVQSFIDSARALVTVETGQFGAKMSVGLINEGPVTFLLECY